MSKRIATRPKKKKYGNRYPWNDWFSQHTFTLLRGADYHCLTSGMAGMLRNRASEMGIKISIRLHESGNGIEVIVSNPIDKTLFDGGKRNGNKR